VNAVIKTQFVAACFSLLWLSWCA